MADEFQEGMIIQLRPINFGEFVEPPPEANKWYIDHDSPAVEYVDDLGDQYRYP